MSVVQVALLLIGPAIAGAVAKRSKVGSWLGPVVIAYLFGILLANLPVAISSKVSQSAAEGTLMLAIPLLLVGTQMRGLLKVAPRMLTSFVLASAAAVFSSIVICLAVERALPHARQMAAMLIGVYVGGSANMAALSVALDVPPERYMALNAAEIVSGGAYLLLLMTFGPRLARFLLRSPEFRGSDAVSAKGEPPKAKWRHWALSVLLGMVLAGISVGAVYLAAGELEAVPILILLTTLGLLCALVPKLHDLPGTADVGDYFLLVFCTATGSLVDVAEVARTGLALVALCVAVMTLTVAIHLLLARLMKIDAGTMLITSTATIFGPAFIAPVAKAAKNDALIAPGVTIGLLGFAVGTYLGLGAAWALGI